jgi:hypothetical protein
MTSVLYALAFAGHHRPALFDVTELKRVDELAAVGKYALPGGFRATVLTLPVGVIDIAVLAVAGVRATDTLVFVVLGGECVERSVVSCGCNGGHVFAGSVAENVVR